MGAVTVNIRFTLTKGSGAAGQPAGLRMATQDAAVEARHAFRLSGFGVELSGFGFESDDPDWLAGISAALTED